MDATATLVVVNPAAGSGKARTRWPALVAQLQAAGVTTDARLTEAPGHARTLVRDHIAAGGREIVVFGGDGTVGEVVAGCVAPDGGSMLADGITISIVHQGTGGDMARGLGIPKQADAALALAAGGGSLRTIDVAVARYTSFDGAPAVRAYASCATVGLGADVVRRVEGPLKRLGDSAAFAAATAWSLARNGPRQVTLSIDGEAASPLQVVDVLVANNRYLGGGMFAAPMAELDDGLLDAIIISAAGRVRLLRTFPKIYKGTHVDDPLVRCRRARTLQIETPAGAPQGVVLDGELVGTTPVTFSVIAGGLRVRVPSI